NGHTTYGAQRCLCHDCHKTRVLVPRRDKSLFAFIERAWRERLSLRTIARIFKVSLQSVLLLLRHLAQSLPALKRSLMPKQPGDVLELDELYSFVGSKQEKRWLWIALCRRTRQVVAFAIGARRPAVGSSSGFR
ncbi:MAG TPA: IS1 family transposase, partial [Rhodothermales bacterium]|nr:IS1 family transposase [Rhodothermales bacterium]